MRERDIELGKLAISRGLASRQTVSDCFKALVPDASLADELVRRGVLTTEQAAELGASLGGVANSAVSGATDGTVKLAPPVRRPSGVFDATVHMAPPAPPASAATDRTVLQPPPGSKPGARAPSSGGAPAAGGALPSPGDLVGDYRIVSLLGKGGMGAVYRGTHRTTGAEAAIKVMLVEGDDSERFVARFRREAEAMAKVDRHAGIVRIRASGAYGPPQGDRREHRGAGLPFAVMDFVKGRDLTKEVRAGVMPVARALAVCAKVARAIHHCHEQGILHRDLKPANILIREEDDEPLVTDFGLAKDRNLEALTKTGEVLGTPAYMAPEQAEGLSKEQDRRTDVYGLGAILYECLTGEPPFKADSAIALMKKVLLEDPADPATKRKDVPKDAGIIALKCLAKEKEHRYATALAVAEELERLHAGEPILARPIGRLESWKRRARRRPVLLAQPLVGLVAVGLAAGLAWHYKQRAGEEQNLHDGVRATLLLIDGAGYVPISTRTDARARADEPLAAVASLEAALGVRDPEAELARHRRALWDDPALALAAPAPDLHDAAAALLLLAKDPKHAAATKLAASYAADASRPDAALVAAFASFFAKGAPAPELAALLAQGRDARWSALLDVARARAFEAVLDEPESGRAALPELLKELRKATPGSELARLLVQSVVARPEPALARLVRPHTGSGAFDEALDIGRILRGLDRGEAMTRRLQALREAEADAVVAYLRAEQERGRLPNAGEVKRELAPLKDLTDRGDAGELIATVEQSMEVAAHAQNDQANAEIYFNLYRLALESGIHFIDVLSKFQLDHYERATERNPRYLDEVFGAGKDRSETDRVVGRVAKVTALLMAARTTADSSSTPLSSEELRRRLERWHVTEDLEELGAAVRKQLAKVPDVRDLLLATLAVEKGRSIPYGLIAPPGKPFSADPQNDAASLDAAIALLREGIALGYSRWIESHRRFHHLLAARARLAAKEGDRAAAVALAREAIELGVVLRRRYKELRDEQAAIGEQRTAAALRRITYMRITGLAHAYADNSVWAVSCWTDAWAHETKAAVGDERDAELVLQRKSLEEGLDYDPSDNTHRRQLAELLELEGRYEEALVQIDRAFNVPTGVAPMSDPELGLKLRQRLRDRLGR